MSARAFAPARFDASQQRRRALLAKVHIAKVQLGMVEDDYRAVIQRHTGAPSAKDASEDQLVAVLKEFEAKGFSPRARLDPVRRGSRAPRRADHPVARKARAMWLSLHQLGVVRNPSEAALDAFACRQLGCTVMQWADQALGYRLIEALKAMAQRHGWDQSGNPDLRAIKRRLCIAILAKLADAGVCPPQWTIGQALYALAGEERLTMVIHPSAEDFTVAAQQLGALLAKHAAHLQVEA